MPLYDRVYNLLDGGDNRKAEKECDSILKKIQKKKSSLADPSEWQTVMALKGIAILRQGNFEYAIQLADEIKLSKPTEDNAVQLCANIYRDCHCPEKIPDLYKVALEAGENEDLFVHAFMAHLRIEDYAEMKIKAMKLFQKYKKIRYLYWQVMCGYFQAVSQKNNPKINLTIARKVFEKDQSITHAEGALRLYLNILEELGDYESISSQLDQSKFKKTLNGYQKYKLKCLENESNLPKIGSEMMNRINEDDNDWTAWSRLIDIMVEVENTLQNGELADQMRQKLTLEGTLTSLDSLILFITERSISSRARAPELAKLYLVDKIKGCPDQWGSLLDLILKYCQKFGGKSSTYFDLEPYLNLLNEEKASSLIESLLNGDPDEKCADSACCSHILPYLFKCFYNQSCITDVDKLVDAGLGFWEKYSDTESIKGLMETEPRPWDRHFLIAAQIILANEITDANIVKSIAILELGMTKTGFSSDLMLMSLNLYSELNCVKKGVQLLRDIDIKSIQYDSMGYVCFPHFVRLDRVNGQVLMESALPFYRSADKDATEQIINCFRHDTYDKVLEMSDFRKACLKSGMRRLISIENQLLNVYNCPSVEDIEQIKIYNENNQDNRDLNGLNMFISNLKSILSSLKTESFLDSSLWCQFREIQIQMIHRVICITSKEGESAELLSQLENDSEVIDKIISEIDQRWKTELDHPFIRLITGVRRPCQIRNVKPYLELVHTCIKTALIIRKGIIFEQKIDPDEISKFTTELEALQKPSSISEMNMLLEVVQLLNVTCSPMIVHMKKIWKKHQSKLTPVQKSIINALLSINTSLKQIQKLELTTDRFSNENPMSEKLQNMSEMVVKTVADEEENVIWRLNEILGGAREQFDNFCRR